jgi:hypothetical protein
MTTYMQFHIHSVTHVVTVDPGSYPDHDSSKREISKLAGLRVYCELQQPKVSGAVRQRVVYGRATTIL